MKTCTITVELSFEEDGIGSKIKEFWIPSEHDGDSTACALLAAGTILAPLIKGPESMKHVLASLAAFFEYHKSSGGNPSMENPFEHN